MFGKILWKYLFILLHPSYWPSNHPTNDDLDKKLLKLLEAGAPVTIVDTHYIKIGPYELWSANHPYSSFTLRRDSSKIPSRYTRHLLNKAHIEALSLVD